MMVLMLFRISSINGITSPTCTWMKWRRHFWAIFMKVSHAMSCTPSWVSDRRERKKNKCIWHLQNKSTHLNQRRGRKHFIFTMHEFKKLVDDSFEELPVSSEEAWVLADDVHDVRSDDGLVVLSSLLLTQTQQILEMINTQMGLGNSKMYFKYIIFFSLCVSKWLILTCILGTELDWSTTT